MGFTKADDGQPLQSIAKLTYLETVARWVVTTFLRKFIRTGHVQLHEQGGAVYDFRGEEQGCKLQAQLRILRPGAFYWKIATREDVGLADAYIDGDFQFQEDSSSPLTFLLILIANRDRDRAAGASRRWWSPFLLTASIGSAASYMRQVLSQNSLTQARRNISQHYDLSNEMFASFMDDSMTYSCARFTGRPEQSLFDAQMHNINVLIDKGRVDSTHHVLDIGCGWGALAIHLARRTGCTCTGITLSEQQRKFAQAAAKAANLEHKVTFQLMDYRSVPGSHRFHRIFSIEMINHSGHEYLPEWFGICDRLLVDDGLLVLQFMSIPEQNYEACRKTSGFITEYIFPGGYLPAVSTVTAAMASGSSLGAEHMENLGPHYCETLLRWQQNFHNNRSQVLKLGFGEKFIRTWNYYFFYCAAGYKSCTLGVYQMVFSRPGNVSVLGDLSVSFPSG